MELALNYNPATLTRNNTPFRLYKHYIHEGGIATPLIAYWPEGIQQASRATDQLGHIIDIMPTIVEVAGASYPREYRGERIQPMEAKAWCRCSEIKGLIIKPLGGSMKAIGDLGMENRSWWSEEIPGSPGSFTIWRPIARSKIIWWRRTPK